MKMRFSEEKSYLQDIHILIKHTEILLREKSLSSF